MDFFFPNSEMLILTWVLFFSPAIIGIGLILDRLEKEKEKGEQERNDRDGQEA